MKAHKSLALVVLGIFTLFFIVGCGSKVDITTMKGEEWVNLDKGTQQKAVEELLKSADDKAKDHTAKYYVRQLNSFFGAPGTSSKLVKDVFQELAVSGKTVEELTIIDGNAWKKMSTEEKKKLLQAEIDDISSKNPAFKAKTTEIYLQELEEIFKNEDERFLKQPVSDTIKKVLTNNVIINGQRITE